MSEPTSVSTVEETGRATVKDALLRRVNPVLEREVQERMRNRRAPLMLFFFVGILTAIAWLVFQISLGSRTGLTVDPTELSKLGKSMFEAVLFSMLLLVLFLVPVLASGSIAGERERETLIPMQLTLLRPRRIVLGKIAASTAFLTFLLIAAAPLLSLSYVVGGVSVEQIVGGLASVIFVGFVVASVSVLCSALIHRTQVATVLAFFLVLVLLLGVPTLYAVAVAISRAANPSTDPMPDPGPELFVTNPMTLVGAVSGGNVDQTRLFSSSGTRGPLSGMKQSLLGMGHRNNNFNGPFPAGPVGINGPGQRLIVPAPEGDPPELTRFMILSVIVQTGLAMLAVALASWRLRTPAGTER